MSVPTSRQDRLAFAQALGHEHADKRVEILRRVGAAGSISQAAREAGVSYKAAWQALDTLSNLAGAPLVERAVGGAGGGGARLTPAGRALLQAADALVRSRREVLARLGGQGRGDAARVPGLALRTSMRNQLPATVEGLRAEAGAMTVRLRLPGGQGLRARITRESAQLLGLRAGLPVLTLCKATAVEVAAPGALDAAAAAAGNLLHGTVSRAPRGGAAGEVALELAGGQRLVGFRAAGLGLRAGAQADAAVAASALAIALLDHG